MNKKFLLLTISFIIILTVIPVSGAPGLNKRGKTAKIFFVNLYEEKVDIQLGEEKDYVFKANELEPYASTYLSPTKNFGEYKLYFKESDEKDFYFWSDDNEQPYICPVKPEHTHCIIIDEAGGVQYYTITEADGLGAKICFLNGTNSNMAKMEIGKSWGKDTVAYTVNRKSFEITNFVTIKPGKYSLFWQFPSQEKNGEYFYYPDETGANQEIFEFKKDNFYLFLAYTMSRDDYAILYNITPK